MDKPQRLARRQEHTSAEVYGARVTPASGSRDAKGDAETDSELFEFKHTQLQSYRLRLADWLAHARHAILAGKKPVLEIEFTRPDGSCQRHVVVLDRDDYLELRAENEKMRAKIEADC